MKKKVSIDQVNDSFNCVLLNTCRFSVSVASIKTFVYETEGHLQFVFEKQLASLRNKSKTVYFFKNSYQFVPILLSPRLKIALLLKIQNVIL